MRLNANLNALSQSGFTSLASKLHTLKMGGGGSPSFLKFELENRFIPIREQSFHYPFIALYGAKDALLLKNLTLHYLHIFVFESDLNLLLLSLENEDFREEITTGKIYFFNLFDENLELQLNFLLNQKSCYEYLDLYELFIASSFYEERYYEHLLACDLLCKKVITHIKSARGVWAKDVLFSVYENFLTNIPALLRSIPITHLISERKNAFETAVIVAAGPSLDKNLAPLKAHQEKIVIFCTDGALKSLLSAGIRADYVLNTDIEFLAKDFLKPCNETLFICGYSSHPKILKSLENSPLSVVLGTDPACALPFLKDFGFLDLGANVAHFAYTLAIALGFKRLIMLGQDFALSPSGASHTSDYALGKRAESKMDIEYFKIKGVGGGEVMTHTTWNFYLKMLENLIAMHPEVTFYNASNGAFIKGSIELSFEKCCEFLQEKKPHLVLPLPLKDSSKLLQKFQNKIQADFNTALQILNEANELLKALKKLDDRDLSKLPLAFLQNFFEITVRFDEKISQDEFLNDGKLSFIFIKKGEILKNTLKIQNENEFLPAFLYAYQKWLTLFICELKQKMQSIKKALS